MSHKEMFEKGIFRILKKPIDIEEVDVDLVVVVTTNKYSINEKCFKFFIGDMNNSEDNITVNHINLPKLNWTFKKF